MFNVLASSLSAYFNLDGGHLNRYLRRKEAVTKSICEELILHDQILIPTQDYLTACGLTLILGEHNLISLLEADRLRFLRLRGAFGYVRGTGPDGALVAYGDPDLSRPQDSDIESSIEAGLNVINSQIKDRQKLKTLLAQQSTPLELSEIVESIKHDSYADLKGTAVWHETYGLANKDWLALPGMEEMEVRVLGPETDAQNNVVDTLLSLALYNVELYLTEKFQCASTSTGSPLGDAIDLKINRLLDQSVRSENLWSLLKVNDVPDLGKIDLSEEEYFDQLLKIAEGSNAREFRQWFHERKSLDELEIIKEYVEVVRQVPWFQRLPAKGFRFAVCMGLDVVSGGLGTVLGTGASFLDTFVVDKLLQGKSPRYFFDELRKFRGKIELQSSSETDRRK